MKSNGLNRNGVLAVEAALTIDASMIREKKNARRKAMMRDMIWFVT